METSFILSSSHYWNHVSTKFEKMNISLIIKSFRYLAFPEKGHNYRHFSLGGGFTGGVPVTRVAVTRGESSATESTGAHLRRPDADTRPSRCDRESTLYSMQLAKKQMRRHHTHTERFDRLLPSGSICSNGSILVAYQWQYLGYWIMGDICSSFFVAAFLFLF